LQVEAEVGGSSEATGAMAVKVRKKRVSKVVKASKAAKVNRQKEADEEDGDDELEEEEEMLDDEEEEQSVGIDSSEGEDEELVSDKEDFIDVKVNSLLLILSNPYDDNCAGARLDELTLEFGLGKVLVAGTTGSPELKIQFVTTAKGNVNGKWRPALDSGNGAWTGIVDKESILEYNVKLNKNSELTTATKRAVVDSPSLVSLYEFKNTKLVRTRKASETAQVKKDALLAGR
jgi:hypothetical protein